MNAKAKGTRNEHKTRRYLEKRGWRCVRAGGSLGAFDLIAFSRKGIRFIQVKSNRGAGPLERQRLRQAKAEWCPEGSSVEIWVWRDYARGPEMTYVYEEAVSTPVENGKRGES
jgi:Holliday junction resolvase-like predicted endonuclease